MIRALLALLVLFRVISNESQTYFVINFMADAVFYFLPFLLASSAKEIEMQPLSCDGFSRRIAASEYGKIDFGRESGGNFRYADASGELRIQRHSGYHADRHRPVIYPKNSLTVSFRMQSRSYSFRCSPFC